MSLTDAAKKDPDSLRVLASSLYLAIAPLKECNYKCAYCHPFGESRIRHGDNMSEQEMKEVIDSAAVSGFERFRFTGGEPTVLPWFGDILVYTLEQYPGTRVNISTNGTTIEKYIDLFERYRDRITVRISLDSTLEMHRKLGFDKVLTSSLEQSLRNLSERSIPARLNMVVTQQNKSEVYNIISLASSLGFGVKLLDLNMQDKYIATDGVAGNKRQLIQIHPLDYWRKNYFNLDELVGSCSI